MFSHGFDTTSGYLKEDIPRSSTPLIGVPIFNAFRGMGRFLAQELSEMQLGAAPGTRATGWAVGGVKIPGEATKLEGFV